MARWIFIAALGATLLATPGWAQRGGHGGMSMGGSRGGHSGGGGYAAHGGGGYAAHGGGGYAYRGGGGYAYRGGGGYARGPRYPWWGHGYAGWGGYPWWGWYGGLGWYGSSYYWDNSYTAQTYPSYVYVTPGDSNDYSQTYQVQQDEIDRLNNEVDRLRAQGQSQSPGSQPQSNTAEIHAETVLIYRDGHAEEVENYAIVGKTIWVFNEAHAKKIALADLDLPATKRYNEDRGIDFVLPNSSR